MFPTMFEYREICSFNQVSAPPEIEDVKGQPRKC